MAANPYPLVDGGIRRRRNDHNAPRLPGDAYRYDQLFSQGGARPYWSEGRSNRVSDRRPTSSRLKKQKASMRFALRANMSQRSPVRCRTSPSIRRSSERTSSRASSRCSPHGEPRRTSDERPQTTAGRARYHHSMSGSGSARHFAKHFDGSGGSTLNGEIRKASVVAPFPWQCSQFRSVTADTRTVLPLYVT